MSGMSPAVATPTATMPTRNTWHSNADVLDVGKLVKLKVKGVKAAAASQSSRPSSSGSSDRDIVLRQKRGQPGVYKVVRTGATIRNPKVIPDDIEEEDDDALPGSDAGGAEPGTGQKRSRNGARPLGSMPAPSPPLGLPVVPATQPRETIQTRAGRWLVSRVPGMGVEERTLMVNHMLGIAGWEVAARWKDLLIQWRRAGTLLQTNGGRATVTAVEESVSLGRRDWLKGVEDWDREFVVLYDRAVRRRIARSLVGPGEWLQSADLGQRYEELLAGAEVTNAKPRRVVGKEEMFKWLYGDQRNKQDLDRFTREIKYWKRWLQVTTTLPRGIVGLMPKNLKKTFVEQKIGKDNLGVWLECIVKFRPEVLTIAETLLPVLHEALGGREPPAEPVRLESWDNSPASLVALGTAWFEPDIVVEATPHQESGPIESRGTDDAVPELEDQHDQEEQGLPGDGVDDGGMLGEYTNEFFVWAGEGAEAFNGTFSDEIGNY
ncbi:hypothetical protein LTR15_012977 [Elasticomyces elasticus]|nr:hypothetical protein LTR15_012977 [Elasticomyces elasticus]